MGSPPLARSAEFVIRDDGDLLVLSRAEGWKGAAPRRVVVELPGLSPERAAHWSRDLSSRARDCGCAVGALVTLVVLAVEIGVLAWTWPPDGAQIVSAVLAVLAAALAGKLIGVQRAKVRLERAITLLRADAGLAPAHDTDV